MYCTISAQRSSSRRPRNCMSRMYSAWMVTFASSSPHHQPSASWCSSSQAMACCIAAWAAAWPGSSVRGPWSRLAVPGSGPRTQSTVAMRLEPGGRFAQRHWDGCLGQAQLAAGASAVVEHRHAGHADAIQRHCGGALGEPAFDQLADGTGGVGYRHRQLDARRLAATFRRQGFQHGPQGYVLVTQDIALAWHALLVSEHVALGNVLHVDQVQPCVYVGGYPAPEEVEQHLARGGGPHVPRTYGRGRVDDDHVGVLEGDALGQDLGALVVTVDQLRIGESALVAAGLHRGYRAGVDGALHAGLFRRFEHRARPPEVHVVEVRRVRRPQ